MTSYPKNKINVLLLENVHQDAYDMFKKDGFNVRLEKGAMDEDELAEIIGDIHVIGIRSKTNITKKVLDKADKLIAIGTFSIGTNQVDLEEAEKKGIPVFNAPYSNTRSVAELVIANIVFLSRKTGDQSMKMHKGVWDKNAAGCNEVRGKTLGIVGYGHIGSQVSILAELFGLHVLYYDVQTKLPLGNAQPTESYEELLQKSDYISFHVPESTETMNMFTEKELKHTKPGAKIINLARGKVIDVEALAKYIKSGHITGAAIDVFPEEPKTNDDPFSSVLQNLPNVILTPHIGGSTEEAQRNIGSEVASKLLKFVNNGSTTFSVNFPNIELVDIRKDYHRILNIHRNQPGFLKDINKIVSDMGGNILSQNLATSMEIGYLVMEIDKDLGDSIKDQMSKHPLSIKTRILY